MDRHEVSPPLAEDEVDRAVSCLRAHPAVRAVRATGRRDPEIELVPRTDGVFPHFDGELVVDSWRSVFDDRYDEGSGWTGPPRLVGWTDGLTGRPVPAGEMAEWVRTTVDRIGALAPTRVLEIGAGTGLLMEQLLDRPGLAEYTGTDLAPTSLRLLGALADRHRGPAVVTVAEGTADAPPPASRRGGYDVAVLNSVVQYFPSVGYLEAVLAGLVPHLVDGGHIYLGDLRHSGLGVAHACLRHARRTGAAPTSAAVDALLRRDHELSVSPDYLCDLPRLLPGVTAVETAPRRGVSGNEMTLFRFDAVLHLGCAPPEPVFAERDLRSIPAFAEALASPGPPFAVTGLGNARLTEANRLRAGCGLGGAADGSGAVDPEELWSLAEEAGWRVLVGWHPGSADGDLDVWCAPGEDVLGHYSLSVPRRARGLGVTRQPVFPPAVERVWLDELLGQVSRTVPSVRRPPRLAVVPRF